MSLDASIAPATHPQARIALRPNVRRALLTGTSSPGSACSATSARSSRSTCAPPRTADANLAAASYELLTMFTVLFGIPLSLLVARLTGVLLGLGVEVGRPALRRG